MARFQRDCSCEAGTVAFQPLPAFTLLALDLYYPISQQENDNSCHCNHSKTNNTANILKLLQWLGRFAFVLCMKCFYCRVMQTTELHKACKPNQGT